MILQKTSKQSIKQVVAMYILPYHEKIISAKTSVQNGEFIYHRDIKNEVIIQLKTISESITLCMTAQKV